jgi:hypothetical protein
MSLIDQPNSDSDESYQDDDDSEDDTTNSGFTDRDYYVPPTQPNPSAVSSKGKIFIEKYCIILFENVC